MREEITRLREVAKAIAKRRSRKRKYIRYKETLIVGDILSILAKKEDSSRNNGERPAKRVRVRGRYSRCGKIRHNSRTYVAEIKDIDNSDKSK